jgi:hypothetical protein
MNQPPPEGLYDAVVFMPPLLALALAIWLPIRLRRIPLAIQWILTACGLLCIPIAYLVLVASIISGADAGTGMISAEIFGAAGAFAVFVTAGAITGLITSIIASVRSRRARQALAQSSSNVAGL